MRSAAPPFLVKDDVRLDALLAMRDIIATAQQVLGDEVDDKRHLAATRVDKYDLAKAIKSQPASEKVARLDCFLTFAEDEGLDVLHWNSIEQRLIRKGKCSAVTARLICHLRGETPDEKNIRAMGADPATASKPERAAGAGGLLVECHEMIDDHRQVILGQLPQSNLFPAVFVYSSDLKQWFPQHDLVRVKKPGGLAFVCNARFGNPHGIAHMPSATGPFPWRGEVRVYALTSEPDKKRTPPVFTEEQLDRWAADHGPVGKVATLPVIRDEPPILSILVESSNGKGKEWVFPPERAPCSFPVVLTWRTRHTIHFEIRKTPTDEVVVKESVLKDGKVRIVDAASVEPIEQGVKHVALPGAGTYRLRSWGVRKPFLDTELELWLEIKSEAPTAPRRARGQRPSSEQRAPSRR